MCSKWVHDAVDWCLSMNMQPVRFQTEELKYDFTTPFTIALWVYYVSKMYGKPTLRCDASTMLLKYLVSQPALVVKAWRNRLYRFSSASFFTTAGFALKEWVQGHDIQDATEREKKKGERTLTLRKVKDVDGLFGLLADAIYQFMMLKSTPFPNAFKSKKNFLTVPVWKRAQIFIHLYRYILDKPANKQWHKYGHENYRTNVVLFRRYVLADKQICAVGKRFKQLPDEDPHRVVDVTNTKKRKPDTDSSVGVSSPAKNVIVIVSSEDEPMTNKLGV